VLGTAGYMSPEQVRGVAADHRADLFAFGAVLYELLSGRPAFGGETMMDVMMAAAREDVPPLTSLRPDLPPALVRLIERCLEKDPARRFQSTRDLAFALESIGGTRSGEALAQPAASGATGDRGRNKWLWPIAGVAVAAMVAVVDVALRPAPVRSAPQTLTLPLPFGFPMFRLPGVFPASPGFWSPSPDNRWLLGIQLLPDGRTGFVLNELANGSERALGVTAGNVSVLDSAWSPDSKSFAYWDATDGFLKRITLETSAVARLGMFRDVRSIGWGADGLVLANLAGDGGQTLVRISPNGGEGVPIARGMRWPSLLPSGRIVASGLEDPRGLVLFDPKSGEKHLLLPGVDPVGYVTGHVLYNLQEKLVAHRLDETAGRLVGEPVVIGDAAELHASASDTLLAWVAVAIEPGAALQGGGPLVWTDRTGHRSVVPGDLRPYGGATLSMHGDVEVATTIFGPGANGADVITVRLDTGAVTRVFAQRSWDAHPRWSRDGQRLIFRSDVSLMIADAASASPPTVVVKSIPGLERVDDWSADGRYVLVSAVTAAGRYDILQVDLQTGGAPTTFAASSATESFARFSPDGAYVAYVSDTTGPPEVYVQPFPAGASRRVSLSGGTMPKWSRDGSHIYFFSPDGWIMEAAVSRERGDIHLGVPQRAAPASGSDFLPSADSQRFLVIEPAARRSLALVNWPSLLAK
jgi:Tol biopolymer transport system component